MKALPFYLILSFVLASCSTNENNNSSSYETADTNQQTVLKVFITGDEKVICNGQELSLGALDKRFILLEKEKGMVYYSRSNPDEDPSETAMKVVQLVIEHNLAIAMFDDSTFSEPLGPK